MTFSLRRFCYPPFLAAAGILLVATMGLQYVVHSFELFLSKEPIELRKQLYLMPDRMGPYKLVNQEAQLTPEMEEVLGAANYISREYQDTRVAENNMGKGLVRLHVAYFTGTDRKSVV